MCGVGEGRQSGVAVYLLQVSLLAQLSACAARPEMSWKVEEWRVVKEGGEWRAWEGKVRLRLAAWPLAVAAVAVHTCPRPNADNGARGVTPRRGREEDLETVALDVLEEWIVGVSVRWRVEGGEGGGWRWWVVEGGGWRRVVEGGEGAHTWMLNSGKTKPSVGLPESAD